MTKHDLMVSLDIGSTKTCAIIAEYNEKEHLEVIGYGVTPSAGMRKGVVVNIEATTKAVGEALEKAEQMAGRTVETVCTGISGGNIEGINSRGVVAVSGRGGEITRNDVDRVIEAAKAVVIPMDREILHVIPQEFIIDGQNGITHPVDMIGVRLEAEVHIITGNISASQNIVKCINRSGYRVNEIILDSMAIALSTLTADERELGVLLIDIGSGTTDVLVHLNGAPYYSNIISLGAGEVTSDLSIMLSLPMEIAERIKLESGCCWESLIKEEATTILPGVGGRPPVEISQKNICRIIQPRMAEIFEIIKQGLSPKGYLSQLGGGIVLTGGGALLPGVCELATAVFNLPARIGIPKGMENLPVELQSPSFSAGVGLVLSVAKWEVKDSFIKESDEKLSINRLGTKLKEWARGFF